jgi:hypothetical protein
MSGSDLAAAFELVARHPEMTWFAGPRPPTLIEAAEGALGCGLPADHREFPLRLGAGSFGAFEIYGVTDEDFENYCIPNGIWATLSDRRRFGLDPDLAIIASTGDGGSICLVMRGLAAGAVVEAWPGMDPAPTRAPVLATTFGAFLLSGVQTELQR